MRALFTTLLLLTLVPAAASAATVDQIVALSKAGVSESVILALIDRDKSVFTIEPDALVALTQAGVTDAVVLAMLKSGRAPQAEPLAPPPFDGPLTIVVGHGPDTPNAGHQYPTAPVFPAAAFVPYAFLVAAPRDCIAIVRNNSDSGTRPLGRFLNDPTVRFMNNGFMPARADVAPGPAVIDCQPVPSHRRPRFR